MDPCNTHTFSLVKWAGKVCATDLRLPSSRSGNQGELTFVRMNHAISIKESPLILININALTLGSIEQYWLLFAWSAKIYCSWQLALIRSAAQTVLLVSRCQAIRKGWNDLQTSVLFIYFFLSFNAFLSFIQCLSFFLSFSLFFFLSLKIFVWVLCLRTFFFSFFSFFALFLLLSSSSAFTHSFIHSFFLSFFLSFPHIWKLYIHYFSLFCSFFRPFLKVLSFFLYLRLFFFLSFFLLKFWTFKISLLKNFCSTVLSFFIRVFFFFLIESFPSY